MLRAGVSPCLGTMVQGTDTPTEMRLTCRGAGAGDSLVLRGWPPRAADSKAAMLLGEEAGQEQPSATAGQKHQTAKRGSSRMVPCISIVAGRGSHRVTVVAVVSPELPIGVHYYPPP